MQCSIPSYVSAAFGIVGLSVNIKELNDTSGNASDLEVQHTIDGKEMTGKEVKQNPSHTPRPEKAKCTLNRHRLKTVN